MRRTLSVKPPGPVKLPGLAKPLGPVTPGLALLVALLGAGCGPAVPPVTDRASPGEQAIDADRAMLDDDQGSAGNNTGSWGGVQTPNIQNAPRLPLPPSRVPGL